MSKPAHIATPKKLTAAERTAKLLAYKPVNAFNSRISPKTPVGNSAMARARAAI